MGAYDIHGEHSKETGCEDVDWIQMVQNMIPWRTFVGTREFFE
jgi:hypothetical protein